MSTVPKTPPTIESPPVARRFSVEEYYRMAEAGILGPNERVELIEGVIYKMSPMSSRHAAAVRRLTTFFGQRLGSSAIVQVQCPIHADEASEPEPDLVLLKPREDFYEDEHPGPSDVLLAIEVMLSSATYDRNEKLRLYARIGLPEAWLVDLNARRVEVHKSPVGDTFTDSAELGPGDTTTASAFPEVEFTIDEFFG